MSQNPIHDPGIGDDRDDLHLGTAGAEEGIDLDTTRMSSRAWTGSLPASRRFPEHSGGLRTITRTARLPPGHEESGGAVQKRHRCGNRGNQRNGSPLRTDVRGGRRRTVRNPTPWLATVLFEVRAEEARLDIGSVRRIVSRRTTRPRSAAKERPHGEAAVRVLRNVRR